MSILNPTSRVGRLAAGAVIVAALLTAARAGSTKGQGPVNLDLEEGELGKVPKGWLHPKPSADAGYKVQLTEDNPKAGKRCALLSRDAKGEVAGFGNLMQSFDATPYRGKRVRFRAAVRADVTGAGNQAQLWLRVDRKDDQPGFFDNMGQHPIVLKEWRYYDIFGEVAEDAVSISLGLMLVGDGKAWLDAVSFEILGKAGEGNGPPRAPKGRELDNLVAFTKLLGYVRFFHPSTEAAGTNWDLFAIDSVTAVEKADDAAELAQTLETLFQPIAPTVRVFPTDKPPADGDAPTPKDATQTLAWFHVGVGIGDVRSIYSSRRINLREPIPAIPGRKAADVKLPDAAKPFTADLGAGVSCRVPLALPADAKGTLPRPAATAKAPGWSKPEGFQPSGKDRATRLADVAVAWNVFQHFYPYFDVVKTDWPADLRKALEKAAVDPDERAFLDTLRLLVAALHDGHGYVSWTGAAATYYPPVRWDWIEDRLVVTRVGPKVPDALKPGAVVVKVNGRPAAEALADEVKWNSGATPQFRRHHALNQLGGGAKDSEITLDVLGPSGETQLVRLRRTLDGGEFHALKETRPAAIEAIKPGILYVDLDRITDKQFQEALPQLEKAKGIIFDLRGYPGQISTAPIAHLIDKPVSSAQWNVPVTLFPDRQNVTFATSSWEVTPKAPRWQAKVAFVTDGRAISYAETYLGIIEHYKLAAIVGAPTAGTNGNINPFTLPGGYRVVWTGMKVLKQDGSRHHGVGIQPTVPVARTIAGVAKGRDEFLERALKVVGP